MPLLPDDVYLSTEGLPTPHNLVTWLGVDGSILHYTYVDQNHDGLSDHIRWQLPLDQFPESLLADTNFNGVPDSNSVLVDLDRDGLHETHLNPVDLDLDGQVDHWVGYTGAPHVEDIGQILMVTDDAQPWDGLTISGSDVFAEPFSDLQHLYLLNGPDSLPYLTEHPDYHMEDDLHPDIPTTDFGLG